MSTSSTTPHGALPDRAAAPAAARAAWLWPAAAACLALVPLLPAFTGRRVFFVRDLSLFFWGRYLWLRRAWLSGEWPLWDPHVGGGQAAYSDALHQMFLPPAALARLAGDEVLGFNLWVALPFPLAALGAWAFLSRRFSPFGALLGAVAFGLCGPVVSTGNFPNLSWCVAAMPWVLWMADRVLSEPAPRNVALLALVVAAQCLAGEPVTLFATLVLALGYAATVAPAGGEPPRRLRSLLAFTVGSALGIALAGVQMIPMASAALLAGRGESITADLWSLRPTALLETVWLHLFGNYFAVQSLEDLPWMPLVYTGREPLLFSIYFGTPLLALTVFGLAGRAGRGWRAFWVAAGFFSLIASFGAYTPVFPILRDHVPPFGAFRFPVKYIMVAALAVAAGAATGWDSLVAWRSIPVGARDERRVRRARRLALALAAAVGLAAGAFAAACAYLPAQMAGPLEGFAAALGYQGREGAAAAFMLRTVPRAAVSIVLVSLATAALVVALGRARRGTVRALCAAALFGLVAGDLLARAAGINPVFDPVHLAQPAWLAHTRTDPHARFYVGGKVEGTLDRMDIDASRWYLDAPGLRGSASRAALSIQAAFYPSAWGAREMLSYDLPVLWPRPFAHATEEFLKRGRRERDRFLDRTGVRYRVLPQRQAGNRAPVAKIPQFYESLLFDWREGVVPRASIVPTARVVPDGSQQVKALFAEGWDARSVALLDRALSPSGSPGRPVAPFARFVEDRSNRSLLEAGAGETGGYLLLLDSYADDWRVTVDGRPATLARANGLFRAVRLAPGRHQVEFAYRPRALYWGTAVSLAALIAVIALLRMRRSLPFGRA